MDIIIDNNIIRKKNIEKIKRTNIIQKVKNGEFIFYACAKIFSQLVPFLRYNCKNSQERREIINFLFELIDNNYIFPSIAEIANREIEMLKTDNYINEFWFDKYDEKQLKNIKTNLSAQKTLDAIINQNEQEFSAENIKRAHDEIKRFQENNLKQIKAYCKQTFENIDNNIKNEAKKLNFDDKATQALINIVRSVDNPKFNNEERKERIYNNLFDKLLEFNLLIKLKNQVINKEKRILIKDIDFINKFYKNYNNVSFTKLLIEATKFGYAYKVNNPNKSYDNDWVNDTSYICCTTFVDILLTDDTKYLKDAFKHIWGENKKIMTLDEFIAEYC